MALAQNRGLSSTCGSRATCRFLGSCLQLFQTLTKTHMKFNNFFCLQYLPTKSSFIRFFVFGPFSENM